jgi:hypothetical protein
MASRKATGVQTGPAPAPSVVGVLAQTGPGLAWLQPSGHRRPRRLHKGDGVLDGDAGVDENDIPCSVCGTLETYNSPPDHWGEDPSPNAERNRNYPNDLYVKRFKGRRYSPIDRICGKCLSEQHEIPDNVRPLQRRQ